MYAPDLPYLYHKDTSHLFFETQFDVDLLDIYLPLIIVNIVCDM